MRADCTEKVCSNHVCLFSHGFYERGHFQKLLNLDEPRGRSAWTDRPVFTGGWLWLSGDQSVCTARQLLPPHPRPPQKAGLEVLAMPGQSPGFSLPLRASSGHRSPAYRVTQQARPPLDISSRSDGRACGTPTVFLDPGPPELLQRCSGNLSPECSPVRGGPVVGQQQLGSGSPGELSPVSAACLTTLNGFTRQILSAYMSQASACRSPDRRTKPGGTGCDQGGSGRKAWNKLGEPRCREEVLRRGGTAARGSGLLGLWLSMVSLQAWSSPWKAV